MSLPSFHRHRGVIFDLDGTLVASQLDFAAMRRDLGLAPSEPILEALGRITDPGERERLGAIILRHEYAGAAVATPMPGVRDLLDQLRGAGLRIGIFTRNARAVTELTLTRLDLAVDDLVAREDAPPKPDPTGLLALCRRWGLGPEAVLFVGDYLYDLEAGQNAGVKTLLYAPTPPTFAHAHGYVIRSFEELWSHLE